MLNLSSNDTQDAKQLWELVLDTTKFTKSKSSITRSGLFKIISKTASAHIEYKTPRQDVLTVARFIGNIEPSYKNSKDQYVSLTLLRTNTTMDDETIDYVCDKVYEVVKPYIMVSSENSITNGKLKIESRLPKKKLIHYAIKHLLLGSEVLKDANKYHEIKARSLFLDNIKANYAWLIGTAIALKYPSVPAMMEDMCLTFIDQSATVSYSGHVVFYDGTIRKEIL